MRGRFILSVFLNSLLVSFIANSFLLMRTAPEILFGIIPVFLFICVFAGTLIPVRSGKRLLVCQHGSVMLYAFYSSVIISTVFHIILAMITIPEDYMTLVWSLLVCIGVLFVVFWDGIICVYLTSCQLGTKWRLIGVLCGMIPIVNLVVLIYILGATSTEYFLEIEKDLLNRRRAKEKLCATRYPILLVHGVFFRDSRIINYWGRIPKELETNGARIFYGNHASAASIADSAAELKARIEDILAKTGAEKLNIIAHSKGGLDCRYGIAQLGMGKYVASLTTVNTPHKGCLFADYLFAKIDPSYQYKLASTYNSAARKLGEKNPNLLAALRDLTDARCQELNEQMPTPEGIFCQSIGSIMTKAVHGQFPLNFSYHLVKRFDGVNDGLVSENSFEWGEKYTLLTPPGNRGISHGDIVDLNRENIPGFDVREFYVHLVNDLKNRGL